MDKMTVLAQLALYTEAPPPLQRRIADAASHVSLRTGDVFYQEGDVGESFAMVGRGDIRVFKTSGTALVEEVAFRMMDVRLAELLLRRFSHKGVPVRVAEATHEELAAELGIVREVVSRLLKEFERTGMVSVARGRLELRDGEQLRRMVEMV
jgi:CRP-like cAMP-binding protein